jgi:hypothetical protein
VIGLATLLDLPETEHDRLLLVMFLLELGTLV